MRNIFDTLPPADALAMEGLTRLVYELRENRRRILDGWQVADEAALLAGVLDGTLPEHPAFDAWLGARVLGEAQADARARLAAGLATHDTAAAPVAGNAELHATLAETLGSDFASRLAHPPVLHQDAVVFALDNGTALTVRYAAADAYSLRWQHAGCDCGIDTAALHRELATFPNHLHDAAGRLRADPLTDPAAAPADNVARVLRALLADPALTEPAA